jgi:hypothetical protein
MRTYQRHHHQPDQQSNGAEFVAPYREDGRAAVVNRGFKGLFNLDRAT